MEPGRPAWEAVVGRFGPDILRTDREIDRGKLAERVFTRPADREFMNALIHPLVMRERAAAVDRLRVEGVCRIFVSEAALTIEAGHLDFFHKTVVTFCPRSLQIRRLMDRDGIGRGSAELRLRSQMPAENKLAHADYIIRTDGSLADTVEQAEKVYRYLLQDYELLGESEDPA
jgi:dephospho-CoA kinase